MPVLHQLTRPVARALRVAARPGTYAGHAREVTSLALTASMWPLGFTGVSPAGGTAAGEPGSSAVLLLHGYGANKSNWLLAGHRLGQAGFRRVHAFNYNPLVAGVPELAERCCAEAEDVRARLGVDRLHLVGHSLGGLVARYAVQVLGLADVGVCATVASPHQGVGVARLSSLVGGRGPARSAHDLRPGSRVIEALRSAPVPACTRFVAYQGGLDTIVPPWRARIPAGDLVGENIPIDGHGHLSIMLSRRLCDSLVAQLGAADAAIAEPGSSVAAPVVAHDRSTSPAR